MPRVRIPIYKHKDSPTGVNYGLPYTDNNIMVRLHYNINGSA